MASTSETGHAKNVANLQKLTEQITVTQSLCASLRLRI